jgi:hypothetical protein
MKTETILIRLTNNDRIIGQLIHMDRNNIAIYAPMLLSYQVMDNDELDITLFPYDPLSETVMAIFEIYHILTYTIPKNSVIDLYNKHWKDFYAELEETRERMIRELKDKYGEENVVEQTRKLH